MFRWSLWRLCYSMPREEDEAWNWTEEKS